MYNGKRKGTKKSTANRPGVAIGKRVLAALKKMGTGKTTKKKFTPRGSVARRLNTKEVKVVDDYYSIAWWEAMGYDANIFGARTQGWANFILGGLINVQASNMAVQFGNPPLNQGFVPYERYVPNCLTNIDNGTTATTRIGNVIAPKGIFIRGILEASKTKSISDAEATVNQAAVASEGMPVLNRYVRTSIRLYIIRDTSMNEKGYVNFSDVFESSTTGIQQNQPFLWQRKIDTLGRYKILKTLSFDLDQDDPQKQFNIWVPLYGIPIRYNGSSNAKLVGVTVPKNLMDNSGNNIANSAVNAVIQGSNDIQSMTNGIYILGVSHTSITNYITDGGVSTPGISWSTRLTFYDA